MSYVPKGALLALLFAGVPAVAQDGKAIFEQSCAVCHDSGQARVPTRDNLKALPRAQILRALETGVMKEQGAQRTPEERKALAAFLSGRGDGEPLTPPVASAMCTSPAPKLDLSAPQWNGWGASLTNGRNQSRRSAGLDAKDLPKLEVKWAFGFPGAVAAATQPVIIGQWVFVGSTAGRVYALNLQDGCIRWTFDADQNVRSAPIVEPAPKGSSANYVAFFTDRGRHVYSVNAETGALIWKTQVGTELHGSGGTPKFYEGRLYVPLTGGGEGGSLGGECCKARGAVTALDAETGKVVWLTSVVREPLMPTRLNYAGVQLYGPSGVSVWTTPTIDEKRKRLYVGTGDSHSDPVSATSDSIIAMDLDTGTVIWSHQATVGDAYNGGCDVPDKKDCPIADGPDFDFQQPPILVSLGKGQRMLVAGAKSGIVHGFDPDDGGREVWNLRVGTGGVLGGVNWGSAVDKQNMYVAVSDHLDIIERDAKLNPDAGGLVAIRLSDGKQLWRTNVRSGCADGRPLCSPAQSAAVTLVPGAVLSGSLDGHLRAYATDTGQVLWDFDTMREFQTVNNVPAKGGSIDVGGPAVAGGMVLTTAGYSAWQGLPGNVLLAFGVKGKD